jgi:nucleotide-binding universal stress UspA family protein
VRLQTPEASSPARGLTELAEEVGADLIAIGSEHGAAGDRIGLTRTAARLLHGAPCAVAIAAPGSRDTGPFRHVGVALDESAEASAALTAGYAIAHEHGSAVTLYSALDALANPAREGDRTRPLALQSRLDEAAEAAPPGVNPRTVLLHGAAARVIAGAADGVVDLLVTGSRSYGPLQRALLGSVSEELIARATHPVVVLPRQAAPVSAAPVTV